MKSNYTDSNVESRRLDLDNAFDFVVETEAIMKCKEINRFLLFINFYTRIVYKKAKISIFNKYNDNNLAERNRRNRAAAHRSLV